VPLEVVTKTSPGKEIPPARFDPNTRYRTECWVKVVGADTEAWVSLHMIAQNRNPEMIQRGLRSEAVTAGEWKKVSFETTTPPEGLAVIVGFVCVGPGKAYFDDFRIEELGLTKPSPAITTPKARENPSEVEPR
jgi:hypothetical protein